jgi:hypothetical protein
MLGSLIELLITEMNIGNIHQGISKVCATAPTRGYPHVLFGIYWDDLNSAPVRLRMCCMLQVHGRQDAQ